MGYDLNIRRVQGERIALDDLKAFLDQNRNFSTKSIYDTSESPRVISSDFFESLFCIIDGNEVLFTFYKGRGEITVKNPNQQIVDKMIEMADFFEAVVIGEEEEVYTRESPKGKFPESKVLAVEEVRSLKWWQKFFHKPEVKNDPYKRLIGANFHYENNDKSFQYLVEFLKRLDASNLIKIEKSYYHVEDYGLNGSIKEIERDGTLEVGLMIDTDKRFEYIILSQHKQVCTVSFAIYKDLAKLEKLIDLIGNGQNFLLGSIFNHYDAKWQSETKIQAYHSNKRSLRKLKFDTDIFDKKCVDVSFHPGRTINSCGLSFVAGYKNFFGPKLMARLPQNFWENPLFENAVFKGEILITQLFDQLQLEEYSTSMRNKQKALLELTNILILFEDLDSQKFSDDFRW